MHRIAVTFVIHADNAVDLLDLGISRINATLEFKPTANGCRRLRRALAHRRSSNNEKSLSE